MLEERRAGEVVEANGEALRERELDRRALPTNGEVDRVHVDGEEGGVWIERDREVGRKRVVLVGEAEAYAVTGAREGLEEGRRNAADDRAEVKGPNADVGCGAGLRSEETVGGDLEACRRGGESVGGEPYEQRGAHLAR